MDIPLPGEPEPVALIPTPSSPIASNLSKIALPASKDSSISPFPSARSTHLSTPCVTESFFCDIPMPNEKVENLDQFSRYSPSGPLSEDDPPFHSHSPSTNHRTNRFSVLGKAQAKKRLLAFSATKQAGGGLMFNLPKKTIVKPNLAKGFEQLTEDGELTPDASSLKKKPSGKKGGIKDDKAKAVVSAIEEIKREELMMRGAFRMAAQSGGSGDGTGGTSLQRQLARQKEGEMYSLVDNLFTKDKDKDKEKKSRSRKHRSSDKKSERRSCDKDKDKGKEKDKDKDKEKEKAKEKDQKSKGKVKNKAETCQLPASWAEFRSRNMNFDQIRRTKREILKKKSSRHSSRSKDSHKLVEQFEKELCNPLDFPSRYKEPLKAVGARQREKLFSQDMVHYTKTTPVISFSANPDIPSSRYRNRSEILSFASPAAVSIMHNVIESAGSNCIPDAPETDKLTKTRLWYDTSHAFMQPKDAEESRKCTESLPEIITELQPVSLFDTSEKNRLDESIKVCEVDSDPSGVVDIALSKWDSEYEDEQPEAKILAQSDDVVVSTVSTVSIASDSNMLVDLDVDNTCKSVSSGLSPALLDTSVSVHEITHTDILCEVSADKRKLDKQSPVIAAGSEPNLVNEYEEFMKSVSVKSEEVGTDAFDQYPPSGSEKISVETSASKKRKRKNSEVRVNSKRAVKSENSCKKLVATRKDKKKRKQKIKKKSRRASTTSSSQASSEDEEDERPKNKKRKIKTKKNKLRSWKKSKKRKKQASSSSSNEISSSSLSSASSETDSSLEDSSSADERIPKKRSKKASKNVKVIKKSKQKKKKNLPKEDLPQQLSRSELIPAKEERQMTQSKHEHASDEFEAEKCSAKGYSSEECCWVDLDSTKDSAMDSCNAIKSLDAVKKEELMIILKSEYDDSQDCKLPDSESTKMRQIQSKCVQEASRKRPFSPSASPESSSLFKEIASSDNCLINEQITPAEAGEETTRTHIAMDMSAEKDNDINAIESMADKEFLDSALDDVVCQVREGRRENVKEADSKFSRLKLVTSEVWENDSQQKWDTDIKKPKQDAGEWEDASLNWFNLKRTPEEQVKSPVELNPTARLDNQNNSSLSDDLNQEVGKRSLRELKYLRDVIKNEVVDEGSKLGSPLVKPAIQADCGNIIEPGSLLRTTMVTSFVEDFSKSTDFHLPVPSVSLEAQPLASELYSPGQEDDKSTRSNSPLSDTFDGHSYNSYTEVSKSDMSMDSSDSDNDSDEISGNNFLKLKKRTCALINVSLDHPLGSIPLPPKPDPMKLKTLDPNPCCTSSAVESVLAKGISRSHESSLLAKAKHVITVKLLPSELRFQTKPIEVTNVVVNEMIPTSDLKTGWKAIVGPSPDDSSVALPTKALKRPSRWSSVPCAAPDHENLPSISEIPLMKIQTPASNKAISEEVTKVDSKIGMATADVDLRAVDVMPEKDGSSGVHSIVSSVIGTDIKVVASDEKDHMPPRTSDNITKLENVIPSETDELKLAIEKDCSERSDREKDVSKKRDSRDRDSSKRQGSRSQDDSKRRDDRDKDTKRKEDRWKDDSRKIDSQGRADSRSRDRHKSEPRRDRRDVKRNRDDRRRSPDRSDKRHAEKHRLHHREDEQRSPRNRSPDRSDRRKRSRSCSREASRRHSRKQSPNRDRFRTSENKDDSRSKSHKSSKDHDKRRSERSPHNANGDSLMNIPLPEIQHHGRDDCCSMDMECCSPVSTFSPLVGLKRSVADSTTISDEELKLANSEQKSSLEGYSKQSYSYESPMQSGDARKDAQGKSASTGELEFSPKRLSLDERLELELGLRMSPRRQVEPIVVPTDPAYHSYWPNQLNQPNQPNAPSEGPTPRPSLLPTPSVDKFLGAQPNQFVGGPNNYYSQQQRSHNFTGAINNSLLATNAESNYAPNVRWDHTHPYVGIPIQPDRPAIQPLQQVIIAETQFMAPVPLENYLTGPPLPTELVNRPLSSGARPLSPRVLPVNIPKLVLIPPLMTSVAVHAQTHALAPPPTTTQEYVRHAHSITENDLHVVHKFYPEASIYADVPSDTESEQKILEMLSKAKKRSLGRKAAHKQKENIRKKEILKARELKKKKLAKYKKAILHEGDTLRRSVSLDLEEIRLSTGLQLSPKAGTSGAELKPFSPVRNFAPLPAASKGILISIGFGLGNDLPLKERRKSVMFADGVRPGEGTSPSAGEDQLSPTMFVPKEKRLRKKKKKIKVHVIRQLACEETTSDGDLPPPPPPPGSPLPELKPYSFPGPNPGKMILKLSKRIALGASRLAPRVVLDPPALVPTTGAVPAPTDSFARSYSDEKTLKLIAYHQAMMAIKDQACSPSLPCQTLGPPGPGLVSEGKPQLPQVPQLPQSSNVVMKLAITPGPGQAAELYDQGNGNGTPHLPYPLNPTVGLKTNASSILSTPAFLDTMGGSCSAATHSIFGEAKVSNSSERIPVVGAGAVPTAAFGVPAQYGLRPPLPQSPQLRNPPPPPPPPPPLPIPKIIATASNPKN